jgi:hypothetical protein
LINATRRHNWTSMAISKWISIEALRSQCRILKDGVCGYVCTYDMHVTKCECASIVFMQRPVFRSHIFMVLSSDADNKNLPLGCTTRPRTQLSCPIIVCSSCPLASQSLIVLSLEPVTIYCPGAGCSFPGLDCLVLEKGPPDEIQKLETYCIIDQLSDIWVGVDRNKYCAFHNMVMTSEFHFGFSRRNIPETRSLIETVGID